jgi:potassium-transporting ATPase KdpC subunit
MSISHSAVSTHEVAVTAARTQQDAGVRSLLYPALVLLGAFTLLTGLVYPVVTTVVSQAAFSSEANGSLVKQGNSVQGSTLIGQAFDSPRYFWGRPSATTPFAYNAGSSSGSNLGPTNPALRDAIKARVAALQAADPGNHDPVPIDLVTASGSGLDPHITPAAAYYQVNRVARERRLDAARVRALVEENVEQRTLGILGEPRVNVLRLNLALDRLGPDR